MDRRPDSRGRAQDDPRRHRHQDRQSAQRPGGRATGCGQRAGGQFGRVGPGVSGQRRTSGRADRRAGRGVAGRSGVLPRRRTDRRTRGDSDGRAHSRGCPRGCARRAAAFVGGGDRRGQPAGGAGRPDRRVRHLVRRARQPEGNRHWQGRCPASRGGYRGPRSDREALGHQDLPRLACQGRQELAARPETAWPTGV